MARQMVSTHTGFAYTLTDAGSRFMVGKDAVHDSMAWADLDGDGVVDLIGIATASGNYEDTDHELVALHVPTGTVAWRALAGEVSKKVSLVGPVLVASTNSAANLRGLDPRTGQILWHIALPDRLKEDPFDGDDRAPAIAWIGGTIAAFECHDDTYHLLDARTGQIVKSGSGKFKPLGGGVPNVLGIVDEDDEKFEAWDVTTGRCILTLKESSQIRIVPGPGVFAFIYHGPLVEDGPWGVQVRVFDQATMKEVAKTQLVPEGSGGRRRSDDDDDDDDDGPELRVGSGEYGVIGGCILSGNRLFYGSRWDKSAYTAQLHGGGKCPTRVFPAPMPGFGFRSMVYCAPALVTAWQKEKGTEKVHLVGHDPNTLAPVWQVGDLGGRSLDRVLMSTATAVLAPSNPGANHNEFNAQTNKCGIRQIDPRTGQVLTEYPIEDVECVEVVGNFLCGAPTYFSGGLPVAYDTTRGERVL